MNSLVGQTFIALVILVTVLTTAACSAVRNEAGDIVPIASMEAGAAPVEESSLELTAQDSISTSPVATPVGSAETPTPVAAASPEPSEEKLPTELKEPTTPPARSSEAPADAQSGAADRSSAPEEGTAPLEAAIADLSEQTGVPADRINLVSMEAVEWSDTSLGCPQEGYMYAQVVTPGFRIILEAQGQQYEYHTNLETQVVQCESQ